MPSTVIDSFCASVSHEDGNCMFGCFLLQCGLSVSLCLSLRLSLNCMQSWIQ